MEPVARDYLGSTQTGYHQLGVEVAVHNLVRPNQLFRPDFCFNNHVCFS